MLDAIFIQSCSKEIEDGRLARLIKSIFKHKTRIIDICVFLDKESFKANLSSLIGFSSLIQFIVVDDTTVLNPTTKVFHFLINYEPEKYKKILLLESDCAIFPRFDEHLNREILSLNKSEWFICGSTYYGNKWKTVENTPQDYSNHMNGVAVYNRSSKFLQLLNELFLTHNLENIHTNYDFALHQAMKDSYSSYCVDSKSILNLSDIDDFNLHHKDKKNEAVVIHTKNFYYTHIDLIKKLKTQKNNIKQNLSNNCRKVPVFLHIPKCAGTYIEGVLTRVMTWYGLQNKWNETSSHLWNFCLRRVSVLTRTDQTCLTLLVYDYQNLCEENEKVERVDDYSSTIYLDDLLANIHSFRFFVFAIVIQSHGIQFILSGIIEAICDNWGLDPVLFTTMRDSFTKAKSMFSYLSSAASQHETTHKAIKSETFESYLSSFECEDSWLIRELLRLKPSEIITEQHYENTTQYLNSFFVIDSTKKTNLVLTKILQECYEIDYSKLPNEFNGQLVSRNESTNKPKTTFNDLNEEAKEFFYNRTMYDQKLYEKYCSRTLNIDNKQNENLHIS